MLLAKITPEAKVYEQINIFDASYTELPYMTAIARPYKPGSTSTNFELQFGDIYQTEFLTSYRTDITLTSDELSTWGTNDEILLSIIAEKLNIEILEFTTTED